MNISALHDFLLIISLEAEDAYGNYRQDLHWTAEPVQVAALVNRAASLLDKGGLSRRHYSP